MYKLTLCVVVASSNSDYYDYLDKIAAYFDEIRTVSLDENLILLNTKKDKVKVEYVQQLTADQLNKQLHSVKGDWILWLHEGDIIDELDLHRLRDWLYTLDAVIGLTQVITTREPFSSLFKFSDAPVPRLFKKGVKFAYYSPQVELLDYSDINKLDEVKLCGLKIYSSFLVKQHSAVTTILKELEHHVAVQPTINFSTNYQCAYEHYKWQKYSHAITLINKAIFHLASKNVVPPAYVYKLKYACLIELNNDEDTLKGITIIDRLYPNQVEFSFYKAILNYKLNRFKQAREHFFYCLELGNQPLQLSKNGVGSYLASFYIGLCFEKEHNLKQALQYYKSTLLVNPSYKAASKAVERLSNESIVTSYQ